MPAGDAYDRSRTYPAEPRLPWYLGVVAFIGLVVAGVLVIPLLLVYAFFDCLAARGDYR